MEGYLGNRMRKKKRGWKALLQIEMEWEGRGEDGKAASDRNGMGGKGRGYVRICLT